MRAIPILTRLLEILIPTLDTIPIPTEVMIEAMTTAVGQINLGEITSNNRRISQTDQGLRTLTLMVQKSGLMVLTDLYALAVEALAIDQVQHVAGIRFQLGRAYLRETVFGDSPQANFAQACYGAYDGAVKPWSWPERPESSSSRPGSVPMTPSSSSGYTSKSCNSITFGTSGLSPDQGSVGAFYGEGSAPGKRPYVHEEAQASDRSRRPPPPTTQAQHPLTQAFNPPTQPPPFTFQANEGKKKKGPAKKVELQPLVGMFNESLNKYDAPTSVRQVLQQNKVDMTWMDLAAWSPAFCKELKRIVTRVPKKRDPKKSSLQQNPTQFPQFQPVFVQPQPQQLPAMQAPQPPYQAGFQPTMQVPVQTQV